MAEYVEISTERTIEHLDQLSSIGLISQEEAKNVIKSRQSFEYRLARRTKRQTDYTSYIQFEINFLEMIRLRRQKNREFSKPQLDFEQVNRIHTLFRTCVTRFQNDVDLWLLHIEFAKKHRQAGYAGRLYKRMLQVHPHRSDLWLDAASWEMEMKQPETARKVFLTALRFNGKNKFLWIAYQRFELLQSVDAKRHLEEKKDEMKSEVEAAEAAKMVEYPEAVTDGRLAVLAFRKAVEANPDDEILPVQLLDEWREFACRELADQRCEELFALLKIDAQHPNLVAAWCQRPMIGVLPGCQLEAVRETVSRFDTKGSEDEELAKSGAFRSLQIRFIFDYINKVAPKSQSKENPNPERAFFLSKVKILVESANEKKVVLTEPVLSDSFDLLNAEIYQVSQNIVQNAVTAYPASRRLWLSLFDTFYSSECVTRGVDEPVYLRAVKESFSAPFPDTIKGHHDAIAVWHAALQLCVLLRLPFDRFDKIWREGASRHLADLGPAYLAWTYHCSPVGTSPWQAAELAFSSVSGTAVKRPLPIELHMARLRLAISTLDCSSRFKQVEETASFSEIEPAEVRKIFDEVIMDVGNAHLDIWLLYVRFEDAYGDLESLTHIAWRARHALPSDLLVEFNYAYSDIISTSSDSCAQLPPDVVSKIRKTT